VSTGTVVTPFFDPLIAKVIVTAPTREKALGRLVTTLQTTRVSGPPNNVPYLLALLKTHEVVAGRTTTCLLSSFPFTPAALTIISPGLSSAVQDLPGRPNLLHGIPTSGAMDMRAHSAANILAGNPPEMEALEVISVRGAEARVRFWVSALVGVAGGHAGTRIKLNGTDLGGSWRRFFIPCGSVLEIAEEDRGTSGGFRVYVAVKGGFPEIPQYLGSKATSVTFGGYQVSDLIPYPQPALTLTL
jgi:urea carboxylase